ncbi:TIM barrel protein [Hydrogenophaga sp. PAMC20947]|uniref:sugar phosphate isomerase/epimerase family protein n=1 Tax=Hydrogenophaga sp. PAMC20947 TaxID=2565558 RepID=UPI00109E201A|nr:TIM barrel protein [Hydrogenophaga sp. PAMC20947]QCB44933.1 sugar phosphate isomerase/epimerase [Hydrogenophaga sp. PAMC20947]
MNIDLFRSLWGWQGDWGQCAAELRAVGCMGVEARLPIETGAVQALRHTLQQEDLAYIAVVFTGGDVIPDQRWTMEQHWDRLRAALDAAQVAQPRFLNILAGNDRWSLDQQVAFFGHALELADVAGVVCSFETHRATSLYSPWLTLDLIAQLPQLRFTTDISHWVVVCERLLNDPVDDLTPFIERVHHVQARVGYAQGAQVPHPAAPEYASELAFHQDVWERVWASQRARGYSVTTLTPEFGPDGYTFRLPFTQAPIADVWTLNQWMTQTEAEHFARWSAATSATTSALNR